MSAPNATSTSYGTRKLSLTDSGMESIHSRLPGTRGNSTSVSANICSSSHGTTMVFAEVNAPLAREPHTRTVCPQLRALYANLDEPMASRCLCVTEKERRLMSEEVTDGRRL